MHGVLLTTGISQPEAVGWVVIALGVIISLYYTVCRPMIENSKAMTELTCSMRELSSKLIALENNNTESHRRLFKNLDKQAATLQDHETRIHDLENRKED